MLLDMLGIVALCASLIFLDLEAPFRGVNSSAVAFQQKDNVGNGNGCTHFLGFVAEVGKGSAGIFTVASWFFFTLRKHWWFKGAAGLTEKVQGRFILQTFFSWQLLHHWFYSSSKCEWRLCVCISKHACVCCGNVPYLRIRWDDQLSLKWMIVNQRSSCLPDVSDALGIHWDHI